MTIHYRTGNERGSFEQSRLKFFVQRGHCSSAATPVHWKIMKTDIFLTVFQIFSEFSKYIYALPCSRVAQQSNYGSRDKNVYYWKLCTTPLWHKINSPCVSVLFCFSHHTFWLRVQSKFEDYITVPVIAIIFPHKTCYQKFSSRVSHFNFKWLTNGVAPLWRWKIASWAY